MWRVVELLSVLHVISMIILTIICWYLQFSKHFDNTKWQYKQKCLVY